MNQEKPTGITKPFEEEATTVGLPFKVVLFNDDWHSFEEVIVQIIKAVGCSFVDARSMTFTVHVKGQAIVFNGGLNQCLKVTSILEEIDLHTQILSE